jgi:hypothetical protein
MPKTHSLFKIFPSFAGHCCNQQQMILPGGRGEPGEECQKAHKKDNSTRGRSENGELFQYAHINSHHQCAISKKKKKKKTIWHGGLGWFTQACPSEQIEVGWKVVCLFSFPLLLRLAFVFPGIIVGMCCEYNRQGRLPTDGRKSFIRYGVEHTLPGTQLLSLQFTHFVKTRCAIILITPVATSTARGLITDPTFQSSGSVLQLYSKCWNSGGGSEKLTGFLTRVLCVKEHVHQAAHSKRHTAQNFKHFLALMVL